MKKNVNPPLVHVTIAEFGFLV